jgi:hypothetical protein
MFDNIPLPHANTLDSDGNDCSVSFPLYLHNCIWYSYQLCKETVCVGGRNPVGVIRHVTDLCRFDLPHGSFGFCP